MVGLSVHGSRDSSSDQPSLLLFLCRRTASCGLDNSRETKKLGELSGYERGRLCGKIYIPRNGRSNVLGRPSAQKRRRQQNEQAQTDRAIVQQTTEATVAALA